MTDKIDEAQATADAALTAVRASNEKTDRMLAAYKETRDQLTALQGGADVERINSIVATMNQVINEANEQGAQDDAAVV